ncbi:MAG: hypothetical protein OIN66_02270 [Candidatus Methanoperedens sp.]|nr:hypothetical protein [Candidatus Methanoperedens sp.]
MNISRHISIDEEHVEKIKPYVEKHNGNFGAAVRELINQAGKHSRHTNSCAIDTALFNWLLKETEDTLVPDNVLDELIDPGLINSIGKLEGYVNNWFTRLEWDVSLSLKYDSDAFPSDMLMEIRGQVRKTKFAASMLSRYLIKNSSCRAHLGIRSVVHLNDSIKVELSRSGEKEAQKSLVTFFGGKDEPIKAVKKNNDIWKGIIGAYLLNNYNMVTLHRNYFEDLLADKIPLWGITIEALAKRPLREIPLKELLLLIKKIYETSRIADRVEIDGEDIVLFHSFRDQGAMEKLKKILASLLENCGHSYYTRSAANMIVLYHRPDAGKRINEIIGTLKTSSSGVDQTLVMFMAFLKGLREIPDIPLPLTASGREIGAYLIQEYEKENNIRDWSLEDFRRALETVDSRLQRESEIKIEGKDLHYTIRRCNIAADGDASDAYACRAARETFKGAVDYAFGNRAELSVKRLLTHGDNFCEVVIRTL